MKSLLNVRKVANVRYGVFDGVEGAFSEEYENENTCH